jgi:hypothetical protein
MALPTTNLALTAVRTALGEDTYSLFELGTSANINKWSANKPIRLAGEGTPDWPHGTNNRHGLSIVNNWEYLQPRGGSYGGVVDEPVRLGDFRAYNHSALPCIYTLGQNMNDLDPTGGISGNTLHFKAYAASGNYELSSTELGLNDWYFGIKAVCGGVTYYRTTSTVLSFGESQAVNYDASINNPATPSFVDAPYHIGTVNWYGIISSTIKNTWSTTPPAEHYQLPHGSTAGIACSSEGSFVVSPWLVTPDATDLSWDWDETTSHIASYIYTSFGYWETISKPDWITFKVYTDSGMGTELVNPNLWGNGNYIIIHPTEANYGVARSGSVIIGDPSGPQITINVDQTGYIVTTYVWVSPVGDSPPYTIDGNSHGMSDGNDAFNLNFEHGFIGDSWKGWSISASPSGVSASAGPTNPAGVRLRTGITATKAGTLSGNIQPGDVVTISIDNVV